MAFHAVITFPHKRLLSEQFNARTKMPSTLSKAPAPRSKGIGSQRAGPSAYQAVLRGALKKLVLGRVGAVDSRVTCEFREFREFPDHG